MQSSRGVAGRGLALLELYRSGGACCATSTRIGPGSAVHRAAYLITGQAGYVRTMRETAEALGAQLTEPGSLKESWAVEGTWRGFPFRVYDYQRPVAGFSLTGVFRVEIAVAQHRRRMLVLLPGFLGPRAAYGFTDSSPEQPSDWSVAARQYPVVVPDGRWTLHADGPAMAAYLHRVIGLIRREAPHLRRGRLVAASGRLYFEGTFAVRPRWSCGEILAILDLLTRIEALPEGPRPDALLRP